MSRVSRNLYRKKLDKLLEAADDTAFLRMIWAVNALQSGRANNARPFLRYPKDAETTDIAAPYAVHPWKLEVLVNELLTTKKPVPVPGRRYRMLNCVNFDSMALLSNTLNRLENAEDGLTLTRVGILREMHRLGQRQFEWQRGFLNIPLFYRSYFIYGGPLTRAHFEARCNISLDNFGLICFAIYAMFNDKPEVLESTSLSQIEISSSQLAATLDLISSGIAEARSYATQIRADAGHISYKRSILRAFPCIRIGVGGDRIVAPLPDLILPRSTSGVFYDVISGSDNVRNEIAARFETYAVEFMSSMLPSFSVTPSYKYSYRRNLVDTPDILLREGENISVIFECKARRMSFEARFSEDPIVDARQGYQEIAKGVFQIWRFVSHHRRNFLGEEQISKDAVGVILTLDQWLSMATVIRDEVFDLARGMCALRDSEITNDDQIPIIFCAIDEFEYVLGHSSEQNFAETIRLATTDKYRGWLLGGVFRDAFPDSQEVRQYPFLSKIKDVLPWWSTPERSE